MQQTLFALNPCAHNRLKRDNHYGLGKLFRDSSQRAAIKMAHLNDAIWVSVPIAEIAKVAIADGMNLTDYLYLPSMIGNEGASFMACLRTRSDHPRNHHVEARPPTQEQPTSLSRQCVAAQDFKGGGNPPLKPDTVESGAAHNRLGNVLHRFTLHRHGGGKADVPPA